MSDGIRLKVFTEDDTKIYEHATMNIHAHGDLSVTDEKRKVLVAAYPQGSWVGAREADAEE